MLPSSWREHGFVSRLKKSSPRIVHRADDDILIKALDGAARAVHAPGLRQLLGNNQSAAVPARPGGEHLGELPGLLEKHGLLLFEVEGANPHGFERRSMCRQVRDMGLKPFERKSIEVFLRAHSTHVAIGGLAKMLGLRGTSMPDKTQVLVGRPDDRAGKKLGMAGAADGAADTLTAGPLLSIEVKGCDDLMPPRAEIGRGPDQARNLFRAGSSNGV